MVQHVESGYTHFKASFELPHCCMLLFPMVFKRTMRFDVAGHVCSPSFLRAANNDTLCLQSLLSMCRTEAMARACQFLLAILHIARRPSDSNTIGHNGTIPTCKSPISILSSKLEEF